MSFGQVCELLCLKTVSANGSPWGPRSGDQLEKGQGLRISQPLLEEEKTSRLAIRSSAPLEPVNPAGRRNGREALLVTHPRCSCHGVPLGDTGFSPLFYMSDFLLQQPYMSLLGSTTTSDPIKSPQVSFTQLVPHPQGLHYVGAGTIEKGEAVWLPFSPNSHSSFLAVLTSSPSPVSVPHP